MIDDIAVSKNVCNDTPYHHIYTYNTVMVFSPCLIYLVLSLFRSYRFVCKEIISFYLPMGFVRSTNKSTEKIIFYTSLQCVFHTRFRYICVSMSCPEIKWYFRKVAGKTLADTKTKSLYQYVIWIHLLACIKSHAHVEKKTTTTKTHITLNKVTKTHFYIILACVLFSGVYARSRCQNTQYVSIRCWTEQKY